MGLLPRLWRNLEMGKLGGEVAFCLRMVTTHSCSYSPSGQFGKVAPGGDTPVRAAGQDLALG
jgi:hypothetical protein